MRLEEQETVINYGRTDDYLTLWTSDQTVMTKIDKLKAWELVKTETSDGKIYAKEYRAPKKLLSFRSKTKTRELTEEQRQVLSERMERARSAKRSI